MTRRPARPDGGASRWILAVGTVLLSARAATAQSLSCSTASADSVARAAPAQWASPLDRPISVHLREASLREVLDRVAALAKVRISYSADLLPLDRATCVSASATSIGTVLTNALSGLNVAPVAGGADQIVLAPRRQASKPQERTMAPTVGVLERVVVTGSATGSPAREMTVGLDVVSGKTLARENATSLSGTLDAYVPGVWSWAQSPSSVLASYASIRGASSFGLSYPKIYIDGIEVANPLLITRFAPEAIDHVEVIRGPQGSALYGTDAISGVINIVSRHEGSPGAGENASVRSTAGVTQSAFAHGVLRQDHSASFLTGSSQRSADLHVTAGSLGDFIPNGHSRDLLANGSARIVGARTSLSSSARFFMEEAGSATSPLVTRPVAHDSNGVAPTTSLAPQSVQEYTVGTTATFTPSDAWTHSLVIGVDGYRLANVQANATPVPNVADSALRASQGTAARATFRASSVYNVESGGDSHGTLTFALEHAALRESSLLDQWVATGGRGAAEHVASRDLVAWQNSTGVMAQANAAVRNTFFLTTGLRVENDSRLSGAQQFAVLPMIGTAAVGDYGPLTVKLRAAFGRGVRPPSTLGHSEFWQSPSISSTTQPPLGAEEQSGTELGLDLFLHRALSVQITRFDQRASGLIQQVAVPGDSLFQSRRVTYWLENVGEITNRGWELESTAGLSHLTATGTLSFVDSRVETLAKGYTGDLIAGARMLQVPATTGSLNVSWVGNKWFGTIGGSRALNWINYDELALSTAFLASAHPNQEVLGPQLRRYWRQYNGGLRLNATASHDVHDMFAIEMRAENLLNYQRNEPDNITIVPGRTIMTGVRVKF